jgi:hypothetical protein
MDKREKQAVGVKLRAAIKRGIVTRPEVCQKCGLIPPRNAKGYSGIHGHHHDYTKPLDVEWLCAKCHRAVTPFPEIVGAKVFGEKNGASKLNEQLVAEIRASPESCVAIAKRLGVSFQLISRIRLGQLWKLAAWKGKQ